MSFLLELKRRKVVRALVLYASAAFALLQVVSVIVDPLGLPQWTMTFLIVLLAAGMVLTPVLAWAFDVTAEVEPPPDGETARRPVAAPRWLPASTVVVVVGLLAIGAFAGWAISPAAIRPRSAESAGTGKVVRVDLTLPEDQRLHIPGAYALPFDISADGERLVYSAMSGGATRLYVRRLESYDATALRGTEGAIQPFFSADGEWVGFFADRELRKVATRGGAPITIARDVDEPMGGAWSSDGIICFATRSGGLFTVRADGRGRAVAVPTRDGTRSAAHGSWPRFIDGDHVLFAADGHIWVAELARGRVRLIADGHVAWFVKPDQLLIAEEETVRAVEFDAGRLRIRSSPVPLLEQVFRGPGSGSTSLAVSQTGTLVYLAGGYERRLVVVDRNGRDRPLDLEPRGYRFPRVSPDGRFLAVTVDPRPSDIWVVDLARSTAVPLTTEAHNLMAEWSPDGSRLAFASAQGIVLARWPATNRPEGAVSHPASLYVTSWLPDGSLLGFARVTGRRRDVVRYDPRTRTTTPILGTAADEYAAGLSPDGRWIAYVSDMSGQDEVYVVPLDGSAAAVILSKDGGTDPIWAPGGGAVYFRSGQRIMEIPWPLNRTSGPARLFEAAYDFTQEGNWDVLPDGRFVMVRADPAATQRFRLVLNWRLER